MKVEKIYLIGVNSNCFRCGEIAEIIGVNICTPFIKGIVDIPQEPRICYHIMFNDYIEDYVPKSEIDFGNYEFVTLDEIINGELPEIS